MSEKRSLSIFEENGKQAKFSSTPSKPINANTMSSPSTVMKEKMKRNTQSTVSPQSQKTPMSVSTPPSINSARKIGCPSPLLYKNSPLKEKQIAESLAEVEFKKQLSQKYATVKYLFDKSGHFKPIADLFAEKKEIEKQYKLQVPSQKKFTPTGKTPRKSPIKASIDGSNSSLSPLIKTPPINSPVRDRMTSYAEKLRIEAKKKFEISEKKKKASYEMETGTQQAFDDMERKLNTDLINSERDVSAEEAERNRNPFNSPLHQKTQKMRRPFFQ